MVTLAAPELDVRFSKIMEKITLNTYRKNKYYPRIVLAVVKVLSKTDEVSPVKVLLKMGNLNKKNFNAWRKGQVPYLEGVFEGSISKANRILCFSKSRDNNIEEACSRHYFWNQSQEKKNQIIANL